MTRVFVGLFCIMLMWQVFGVSPQAEAVQYTGYSLKDPFHEESYKGEEGHGVVKTKEGVQSSSFVLEGVVWNSKRPQAIMNGKIVELGGKIGDAEITAIDKKGVKIRTRGQEFYLTVKREG